MKRVLSFLLCAVIVLALIPAASASYSTVSNRGVALEYPARSDYFTEPFEAVVCASRENGSIYFMPKP